MHMLIDMPLEELKQYTGRNPKPHDHEAYWQKALEEQQNTDPQAVLKPVSFPCTYARCFDLYFTGVGGARVYAKFIRPVDIATPRPALLFFHGYSGDSGSWSSYLQWVAQGFCVAAMDCRGQGGRSIDVGGIRGNTLEGHIIRGIDGAPKDLLYRQIFLDTVQLFRVVSQMEEVDATKIGAMGGSQGGGLSLACAALNPTLNSVSARVPFLCDYKRVWEMGLAEDAYVEIKQYFRHFDPRHEREDTFFTKLGYIDVQHLAPRIRAKVLMHTGLADNVCPPSTQFAAYNKITAEKKLYIYPDFGHEYLPGSDDIEYEFFMQMVP